VVHASGSRKTVICLIRIQEKPGSTPGSRRDELWRQWEHGSLAETD